MITREFVHEKLPEHRSLLMKSIIYRLLHTVCILIYVVGIMVTTDTVLSSMDTICVR